MEWFVCICWFCSSEFIIFLYFCENQYLHIYSEKFFGMSYFDLKVLPMKSSHSQLHFSYIWCIHISHQSKVTCIFLSKSARLITLDPPYHMCMQTTYLDVLQRRNDFSLRSTSSVKARKGNPEKVIFQNLKNAILLNMRKSFRNGVLSFFRKNYSICELP